jgi:uncharacterized membrane protein YcaP (DUF421 family)
VDRAAWTCGVDPHEAQVAGTLFALPSALLPTVNWWELVLRALLIYLALLIALRVFGKREVGQFTLYDLVFIAIREHGMDDVKEVQLGVLEPDGTISIVPSGVPMQRTKHRIRYHHRAVG